MNIYERYMPRHDPSRHSMPVPDPDKSFAEQRSDVLLGMCLFGEARSEMHQSRRAIAQLIVNRARFPHAVFGSQEGLSFEENLRRVILAPAQFSCFLPDDPNYRKLLRPFEFESPIVWQFCIFTAQDALAEADQPDLVTLNSDHYFDDSIHPPAWANPANQTVEIGRLTFYRLYLPAPKAGAGFLLHAREAARPRRSSGERGLTRAVAGETPAPSPSHRASFPSGIFRRAARTLLRRPSRGLAPRGAGRQAPPAAHRRQVPEADLTRATRLSIPRASGLPALGFSDGINGAGCSPACVRDSRLGIRDPGRIRAVPGNERRLWKD